MRNNTIAALIVFLAGTTACGYSFKKDDEGKPPVNVVCWQDGKDFFKVQAGGAVRRGGLVIIDEPQGAEGVTIELSENTATCAIVTTPPGTTLATPGSAQPAPSRELPPQPAPVASVDAGPASVDAGVTPSAAPAKTR